MPYNLPVCRSVVRARLETGSARMCVCVSVDACFFVKASELMSAKDNYHLERLY